MGSDRQPAPLTGTTLWLSATLLAGGNFVVVLDLTVANVSVPTIAGGNPGSHLAHR